MSDKKECNMVIIEDGDLNYWWECSACQTRHKDTRKFEKSKSCPSCGAAIKGWFGMDDEYPE